MVLTPFFVVGKMIDHRGPVAPGKFETLDDIAKWAGGVRIPHIITLLLRNEGAMKSIRRATKLLTILLPIIY
jgi:hypothetical protein